MAVNKFREMWKTDIFEKIEARRTTFKQFSLVAFFECNNAVIHYLAKILSSRFLIN